jgi:hypothetical protein
LDRTNCSKRYLDKPNKSDNYMDRFRRTRSSVIWQIQQQPT